MGEKFVLLHICDHEHKSRSEKYKQITGAFVKAAMMIICGRGYFIGCYNCITNYGQGIRWVKEKHIWKIVDALNRIGVWHEILKEEVINNIADADHVKQPFTHIIPGTLTKKMPVPYVKPRRRLNINIKKRPQPEGGLWLN